MTNTKPSGADATTFELEPTSAETPYGYINMPEKVRFTVSDGKLVHVKFPPFYVVSRKDNKGKISDTADSTEFAFDLSDTPISSYSYTASVPGVLSFIQVGNIYMDGPDVCGLYAVKNKRVYFYFFQLDDDDVPYQDAATLVKLHTFVGAIAH